MGFIGLTETLRAQDTGAPASAAQLFNNGLSEYNAGDYDAARALLRRVDPMQLPKQDRIKLYETLKALDAGTPAPAPAPAAAPTPPPAPPAPPAPAPAQTPEPPAPPAPAPEEAAQPQPAPEVPAAPQAPAPAAAPTPEPAPAPAPPTADELLASAESMPQDQAAATYRQIVAESPDSAAARTAQARLAQLQRNTDATTTQAKALLDEAGQALEAGDAATADAKLAQAQSLNAKLSWFDRQRLNNQLSAVNELKAAQAPAAAEAPAQPEPAAAPTAEAAPTPAPSAEAIPAASPELFVAAQKQLAADKAAQAAEAQRQGLGALAVQRYEEAVALDPENQEYASALAAARSAGTVSVEPESRIDEAVRQQALLRQAAQAEYDAAMAQADAAASAGDFAAAEEAVNRAKVIADRNQSLFGNALYTDLRGQANSKAVSIEQQKEQRLAQQRRTDEQTRAQQEREALARAQREQRETLDRLLTDARELQKQMRYEEAVELIDQGLMIDPTDIRFQLMKEVLEDLDVLVGTRQQKRAFNIYNARQHEAAMEAKVPYTELISYPQDWPALTERRRQLLEEEGGESKANRDARLKLNTAVPINFEAASLENVINFLRQTTGANIVVQWPALELAGISPDTPITLTLSNVPALKALDLVLQQAGAEVGVQVTYTIDEGIVIVSTRDQLRASVSARVYSIRDLLVQVPNFTDAPEFDLGEALGQGAGGGSGGGGGQSVFGDAEEENEDQPTREELVESILDLIRSTVGTPEEWEEGGESSVRELNGSLFVKTSASNHRDILGVLAQFRERRATQISVEARFLLVDNNFLEEFGLDLDFRYRAAGNFGPIAVEQDSITTARRGNTELTPSRFISDGVSTPTALSVGVNFIDDLEVSLLVNATQASQRSITLNAPRVTFFDGQRAYVVIARQVAFISDLEPVPDTGSFDVTVGYVNSGVVLDVEGTVSADRRYVTLTLRPSLATLRQPFRQVVITGASDGISVDGETGDLGGGIFSGTIELPELELTTVRATVSIPDKGTILLGGQRLSGDLSVESGVPVLSKLPILNRLFTNTSTVQDERTLLILIKPTIILQNEQEDILFPGMSQDPGAANIGPAF